MGEPVASKVALVTGATDGIGKQTALELARRGFRVLVHGRSEEKAAHAASEIVTRAGVPADLVVPVGGDLASLAAVRALGLRVSQLAPALDVLVNNAGVYAETRVLTVDGFESSFAVNHLAPFLLTALVWPSLAAAPAARVVNVSSIAHTRARLAWDDLDGATRYEGYAAYSASKLANVLFTYALAKRAAATNVTSNALHPGVITTKLLWQGFGTRGDSLERGAATSVRVATDPALSGVTGRYFDNEREARSSPASHDEAAMSRLWAVSVARTGAAYPF